jgi:hypothetical protein
MTLSFAVLATALLFGGMTLYSFGFAAFLFNTLPAPAAGGALPKPFRCLYVFVIPTSSLGGVLWWQNPAAAAALLAAVAFSTVLVRQWLMPAINRATDAGQRRLFKWLHGLSVLVTLGHIAATGWLLAHVV